MAEFGRSGIFFAAFFWAAIVSRKVVREFEVASRGFDAAFGPTLLVKEDGPLLALGFEGSFSSKVLVFVSIAFMMLR